MANKRRCGSCKEYFDPDDMFKGHGVQAFCSQDCMNRARPKKRHKSGVPGPTRNKAFQRFNHMCAYCGRSGKGLQVHHIKYRSEGVDHSLDNLIVLCAAHHDMVHSDKRKWQPILKEYVARIARGERRAVSSLPLMEKELES